MPKYLLEVSYTADGVKGLRAEGGTARVAAATALTESVGGTIESFYYAFGSCDAYVIVDAPDNTTVAAASLAVSASGGATVRTVALLTPAEIDAAVAHTTTYRAPGS